MDKPISSMMEKDVITVCTEDSLEKIESVLDLHDLTYVPVVDMRGSIFGIITAHDLLHIHAMKKNPKVVYAWEICTHRPIEVSADTPALDVARLMVDRSIHHVLVTENGALLSSREYRRQKRRRRMNERDQVGSGFRQAAR